MDRVDAVVVGAGVVGLAVARSLAQAGHEVLVLEAARRWGEGVSSRSSEVIHAGLHSPPNWLKTRLCLRGRELLYRYCAERGLPHRRTGKLLVAVEAAQVARLDALAAQAEANGIAGLQRLDGAEARALEPALRCAQALWSPQTGIVDSHALMLSLVGDIEARGGLVVCGTALRSARRVAGQWQLTCADGSTLACPRWVNAAGLSAQAVARQVEGLDPGRVPAMHRARGSYFTLAGRAPFERLIYPMPVDGGLGVHLTLDLGGQARFGPDVEWLDTPAGASTPPGGSDAADYRVDPASAAAFETEVRRWWPALPAQALQPGYAGIRPKLSGPGEPARDFRIDGPDVHGLPGLVNLFGIESPGLTSALALGESVAALLRDA